MVAAVQKCKLFLFRMTFIAVFGTLLFSVVSQATLCGALLSLEPLF